MASPWLDTVRFPGRAFQRSVGRAHQPLGGGYGDCGEAVASAWAAHLGVQPSDFLLCSSDGAALRLVLHGLLAPGDLVLLAEPAPSEAVCAILAAGARYVDVGRRQSGGWDEAALDRALAAHPDALLYGEAPGWLGVDDGPLLATHASRCRGLVLDARFSQGWGGPARRMDELGRAGVWAQLVALRDPDSPGEVLLHGVACAPGTGADLGLLHFDAHRPQAPLRQALAVLEGLADPEWTARADAVLAARHGAFAAALADWPGVQVYARAGFRAAAACLAGDAAAVAAHVGRQLAPVAAYGGHPMRHLVTVDLGVCRVQPAQAVRAPA